MNNMLPNGARYATSMIVEHDFDGRANARQDEGAVSAGDVLRSVWQRIWIVLLVVFVSVSAAVGIGLYQTPTYEASIKVLVGQRQGLTETPGDVVGLQQLTQTMAEVAHTRTVANAVIQELGLGMTAEEFLENMSVEQIAETQVIEISFVDTDPGEASRVANAIGDEFSDQVSRVSQSANSITATSWERAIAPDSPASPNLILNVLLALILGSMLGVGLALLLEHLDDSWRSPEEVEQVVGVPTFGVIREFKFPKSK